MEKIEVDRKCGRFIELLKIPTLGRTPEEWNEGTLLNAELLSLVGSDWVGRKCTQHIPVIFRDNRCNLCRNNGCSVKCECICHRR